MAALLSCNSTDSLFARPSARGWEGAGVETVWDMIALFQYFQY